MAGNNYFEFKQFRIIQKKAAMKVGTDGILLGAWTNISKATNILDVGTGTGLITLMLAQRTNAQIRAIEIERNAADEAILNASNSPWQSRIEIKNISLQEFVKITNQKFDLIVSNPPFFENSLKKKSIDQTIARHTDSLSYSELINGVKKLLRFDGRFSVILPQIVTDEFIEKANVQQLYLVRQTNVKSKPSKPSNRYLLEFSGKKQSVKKNELTVYNDSSTDYSPDYKHLTKNFYLNF